ncbi:uncharacterized protein EDB93DRAFT_1250199 [Suillus bovinus]|uniref:uncharacterized protein n=1 Tax=Suillus bovinus TaxID=48563 RepID=UPI001B88561F|nr:uncharacterized protein EDB93DRAFT_1250199 [Suillus bovinus]KAG2148141.1 hypothetical protein EDB93DRAFT_1250199 [Suillus bovinus]
MSLHHVEVWTGKYFQCTSLRDIGLRVQLGHPSGVPCCNPIPAFDHEFMVLNINGIHSVALHFCNCESVQTHTTQLLHARWYPATSTDPQMAATFRLLNHFQMYTFESKGSAFKYYQALSHLTDNTGTERLKDCYESLLCMSCQYRHLIALKWAGHVHDISGILGTNSGELAMVYPTCPQPGKNLPPDWADAPPEKWWLYGFFIGINTNFCMCHCNKSSEEADPSLSKGWAYFVEGSGFKSVLELHAGFTQEKSSCASHNAVNLADLKRVCGLAATGIGAIVCTRHNFKRPSAVGDLQKGRRMARMDGEASEHGWSNINPVATSTREMGPGLRHDILDDHFGDWNWQKVSNFGVFLLQKFKDAIPRRNQHISNLVNFEDAIPAESLAIWHTMASVRLELSQVEADQLKHGLDISLHSKVSPSVLIAVGIKLETQQCRLIHETSNIGAHATQIQLSTLQQRTNTLHCQIKHWIKIQTLYMPCVACLRETIDATTPDNTEEDIHIEWKLRRAQGHEVLHELHQHLWLKHHLTGFKRDWITGQRGHTRSCGIINTVQKKIDSATTKYRITWNSLDALAQPLLQTDWMTEFLMLEKEDVCGMTEDQAAGECVSEGRRLVSVS